MRDYISRKEAIEALTKDNLQKHLDSVQDGGQENRSAIRIIMEMPTADVIEVVRCKDCKFSVDYYNDGDCYCKIPKREMVWVGNNWNGYCSHGERKEV